MIMVKIGDAYSLSNPKNESITPDDRQETIEIIGGVVVQDFGRVEQGDKISWTLQFWKKDWDLIKQYWNNRELVEITDAAGEVFFARVVVRSYSRIYKFENKAIEANIELWRL